MENPVAAVTSAAKSAFTVRNLALGLVTLLVVFAIAELLGITGWLLTPIASAKAKWGKKS